MATLYIFSGLPAVGKSTLAQLLAQRIRAMYVRIDTVEQGLRDLCGYNVEGEGYRLSYRIIRDNLALGISAVADSCNPIELTRNEWQAVAENVDAKFVNIEISCSDSVEHERRAMDRECSIVNLKSPSWQQIQDRHYEPWDVEVVRIDTAGKSIEVSLAELVEQLCV